MTADQIRDRITDLFQKYYAAPPSRARTLVPASLTAGKLYEAYGLALISRSLVLEEGFSLRLVQGTYLTLKTSPGPINRAYPHVELLCGGRCVAEMWTDVEFTSLSYGLTGGGSRPPERGEYHELDVAIVEPGLSGRPPHGSIWLAAECKNTGYHKGLLKEVLGVRRELSLLQGDRPTRFRNWPRPAVPADPPSCLVVFATDAKVLEYARPGEVFGIDFYHEALLP